MAPCFTWILIAKMTPISRLILTLDFDGSRRQGGIFAMSIHVKAGAPIYLAPCVQETQGIPVVSSWCSVTNERHPLSSKAHPQNVRPLHRSHADYRLIDAIGIFCGDQTQTSPYLLRSGNRLLPSASCRSSGSPVPLGTPSWAIPSGWLQRLRRIPEYHR